MNDLFSNAVLSIQLGIEDYQSNDDRRPISAVRNFYAGVVLLGKQCLVEAAPNADPMDVLTERVALSSDGEGGVAYSPKGSKTIDLDGIRERFKGFGLKWPNGDIGALQKLRNSLEHYHSDYPKETLREAIANGFPLVDGFFKILDKDPHEHLGSAWDVMLEEDKFFNEQKEECDKSLAKLPWGEALANTELLGCPQCGSSLLFQEESENDDAALIIGKCKACGNEISSSEFVKIVVIAEHAVDEYVIAKEGLEPTIYNCPECGEETYAYDGDADFCYYCGHVENGECARCFTPISVANVSFDSSSLCDYCGYVMGKEE